MKMFWTIVLAAVVAGCSVDKATEVSIRATDGTNGANGANGTDGQNGTNGTNGVDGKNGHSVVSSYSRASECECETSGSRLDMYIDMDDNLQVSESDVFTNSLVVCDGRNGRDGLDGQNGADGQDGRDGEDGERGATGAQGPQGIQGMVGPQGAPGAPGTNGMPGPMGPQGPQGPQGMQGPAGSSGATIAAYSASSCTLIAGTSTYVKANGSNYKLYTSSSCSSSSAFAEVSQGESYWVGSNKLAVWYETAMRVITFN